MTIYQLLSGKPNAVLTDECEKLKYIGGEYNQFLAGVMACTSPKCSNKEIEGLIKYLLVCCLALEPRDRPDFMALVLGKILFNRQENCTRC